MLSSTVKVVDSRRNRARQNDAGHQGRKLDEQKNSAYDKQRGRGGAAKLSQRAEQPPVQQRWPRTE